MTVLVRTRPTEDYDRVGFTIDEVERMTEIGILPDDNSFELWEGEIVLKVTKNDPHEITKAQLNRWLQRNLPDNIFAMVEPTFRLDRGTFLEPDVLIVPETSKPSELRGADALLAIEVSDTSLSRDLRAKARLYAMFGVRQYWVVDAKRRRTFLHTGPNAEGYDHQEVRTEDETLTLPFDPALSFRLSDLG